MTFNFCIRLGSNELRLFKPPKNRQLFIHKGPIQVPGKDRFLRQRCSAQFVSVRATRFLAAKAVTGYEPGRQPTSPAHSIFNQKPPCTKT